MILVLGLLTSVHGYKTQCAINCCAFHVRELLCFHDLFYCFLRLEASGAMVVGLMTMSPLSDLVKPLVPMVVGSMIGHVPLPEVMRRLLKEPAYSGGQLGQLRPLLTGQ